ncbi:hypothetical protein CKO40_16335 [Halochromatium glycolicum]|uniref:Uncharacterized protein n=1 Tax=Halochromatium glycolicum TaxID=85075 RepID=A0AAJ0U6J0_9GAMM|nr:hypothetical protein [Halochromatium glycolicum]
MLGDQPRIVGAAAPVQPMQRAFGLREVFHRMPVVEQTQCIRITGGLDACKGCAAERCAVDDGMSTGRMRRSAARQQHHDEQ